MKYPAYLSLIVAAASATAIKASPKLKDGGAGLPGGVYTCDAEKFTGNCGWTPPSDRCHINGGVKSLGPDRDGTCTLYTDANCEKATKKVEFPGIAVGLPEFGSFKCQA